MSHQFKKAIRSDTSVLLAYAGPSGGGKTWSGLATCKGLAGDRRFCCVDTESGRSSHYADKFDFDVYDMRPPYSPQAYTEAIEAAEAAGYPVIFIDSASHEWNGIGSCQDIHDETLQRLTKGDESKMERMSALAWRDAKMAHKRMMARLLQCRSHLVFGLRAEDKIKFVKVMENGRERTVIEHVGFQPIAEKAFMFEMTASFMLTPDAPGIPKPIKLPEMLKPMFPLDRPITEESGRLVGLWAAGGAVIDDTARHIKALTEAPDLEVLKSAFEQAYRSSKAEDVRARLKAAYDSRKATLGERAT